MMQHKMAHLSCAISAGLGPAVDCDNRAAAASPLEPAAIDMFVAVTTTRPASLTDSGLDWCRCRHRWVTPTEQDGSASSSA